MASAAAAPRFVVTLAVLVAIYIAAALYGGKDIVTWFKGVGPAPAAARVTAPVPAAPAAPVRLAARIEGLGRSPVARFVFDPAVPGRIVSCDAASADGGRTWPPLEADPLRRPMLLGGAKAAPPAAGPGGRILCGDVILPRGDRPTGLDEIQIAAEWTGTAWRSAGLPAAESSGDTQLDEMVAYDPSGTPLAVRGDRLITPSGVAPLPGRAEAFAMDAAGAFYAAIAREGRRPALMWTPDPTAAWTEIPAPGPVRAIAADGPRAWAVADMLGRGSGTTWAWTRWPVEMTAKGVAARGDLVVVWGGPKYGGGYGGGLLLISRDGGATLDYAPIQGVQPSWVAIDPHQRHELLVVGDDRTLSRIRF